MEEAGGKDGEIGKEKGFEKEQGKEKIYEGLFQGGREEKNERHPLPRRLQEIRALSVSVYISNIPPAMTRNELSAMVWGAGRLIDCFIPLDLSWKRNRGFAFVRFSTEKEARQAVDLITGRSWGNRKLHAQIAKYPGERKERATSSKEERQFAVPGRGWSKPPSDSGGKDLEQNREAADHHRRKGWGSPSRSGS